MSKRSVIREVPKESHPNSQPGYQDLLRLLDKDTGIVSVISQRSWDGALTSGMFREYDREGRVCRTSFVPHSMMDVYIEQAVATKAAMDDIKKTGMVEGTPLPFPAEGTRKSSGAGAGGAGRQDSLPRASARYRR